MTFKNKIIIISLICVCMVATGIGIICRSGIVGIVYYSFYPDEKIHIEIDSEISDEDMGFDILGPVFGVTNVGDKTITVKSENGLVADATTDKQKNDLVLHLDMKTLKNAVSHQGDGEFWWEYVGKDSYKIQVIISKYGIVLERRNIYLEQNLDTTEQGAVYNVEVE